MKHLPILALAVGLWGCAVSPPKGDSVVQTWYTTGDGQHKLEADKSKIYFEPHTESKARMVFFEADQVRQEMEGFGFTLTGGSAYVMQHQLDAATRRQLLEELFGKGEQSLGINFVRLSIGASDLDAAPSSYFDAIPWGDIEASFNIRASMPELIPTLKEILAINPDITFMAVPWSAPIWMKDNRAWKGGKLLPEFYDLYARYFVKYLREMDKEGIRIKYVVPQNEPENPHNTPSLTMTAEEQAAFVKKLGGRLVADFPSARVVIFDHNCDHPEYPIAIMNDPEAKKYVAGSAFHLYAGDESAMSKVHDAHPDRHIFFTEQWIGAPSDFGGDFGWHMQHVVIGSVRNYARAVLEWNLATDSLYGPHTADGGCDRCLGAVTITRNSYSRNTAYYIIGQVSKFVPRGSLAVKTETNITGLSCAGFVTPKGQKVLVAYNANDKEVAMNITEKSIVQVVKIPPRSAVTCQW